MKRVDIASLTGSNIKTLRAYQAENIPCRVKLDANESPYGFALDARALKAIETNRYPDPEARALKRALAKKMRVSAANILVGNGSDELIYYLINTFGGPVLYPEPTFSMYGIISQSLGKRRAGVPLDGSFDIDLKRTLRKVRDLKPRLLFLSTPNNPTGNSFSESRVLKLVSASPGIVVVDEAYQPFSSRPSLVPLIRKYENLAVLRTLSKVGLAALRVGVLVANKRITAEVNKVRLPFNLNALSEAAATSALKNPKRMDSHIRRIRDERKRLMAKMERISGVTPFPSDANFILFKVDDTRPPRPPRRVHAGLIKRGVLVRDLAAAAPGCLRVTVGTRKENDVFIKALREVIK